MRYRIDGVLHEVVAAAPRAARRDHLAREDHGRASTSPRSACRRTAASAARSPARTSTCASRRCPTAHGERVVMRLLDESRSLLDLADIGFGDDTCATSTTLIQRPHGIMLVTGPTGSGKTTTLYAAWPRSTRPTSTSSPSRTRSSTSWTGISQTQVNAKIDLTFAPGCARSCARIPTSSWSARSATARRREIAIQASLTGHLVLSTVHTNDAAGAITRLVDMGVEPFLVVVADRRAGAAPGAQALPSVCKVDARRRGIRSAARLRDRLPRPNRHLRADADRRRDRAALIHSRAAESELLAAGALGGLRLDARRRRAARARRHHLAREEVMRVTRRLAQRSRHARLFLRSP